jgi:CIC family chloride channel protein
MLVALSEPPLSMPLVRLAASIARDCNYELECLHVVTVPQYVAPSEAEIDLAYHRRYIETAIAIAQSYGIPTHAQIRIAHDIVPTILETLRYRNIDRLVMGWNTDDLLPSQLFGARTDRILRHVNCEVVLVKWGKRLCQTIEEDRDAQLLLNRWLVPISGGQHAKRGLDLLSGLVSLGSKPAVRLCRVFEPECVDLRVSELKQVARELGDQLQLPVTATPLVGRSVIDRTINLAHRYNYDVVLLGASEQTSLQHVLRGHIPYEIARGCNSTVILVRGAKP